MTQRTSAQHSRTRGIALIASLLMLVLIGIISVAMFRSFTVGERIAGAGAEKERAFQVAQSALGFGEWWLSHGNAGVPSVNCHELVDASYLAGSASPGQVCNNALTLPIAVPLLAGIDYTPIGMTIAPGGGIDAAGNANYAHAPQLYLRSLGYSAVGDALFEVTAVGFGASASSVAITQSTYQIKSGVRNLGGL